MSWGVFYFISPRRNKNVYRGELNEPSFKFHSAQGSPELVSRCAARSSALRAHLRCAELNTLGSIRIAEQLTRLADVAESARRNNESVL